jgi:hypothetical protein
MSFGPTSFRPFARQGFGGRGAGDWRGLTQTDKNGLTGRTVVSRGQVGTLQFRSPGASVNYSISGVTRDNNGTALGFARVELFITAGDKALMETVSDISGNFRFDMPGTGPFYLLAYKAGSPDIAGTTVNTIVAT